MSAPARAAPAQLSAALAAAVRILAVHGAGGASDAIDAVRRCLSDAAASLVLRSGVTGEVLGAAPPVISAPPPRRAADDAWSLDIPVRVRGCPAARLSVTTSTGLRATDAGMLGALADVLGLTLAGDPAYTATVAAQQVLDGEADRAQLAAEIDERLGDALVALGHTTPDRLPDALAAAREAVREIRRDLRATALHGGLRRALLELRRPGVRVNASDPRLDTVVPAVAVVVERVAEAATRGVDRAHISAGFEGGQVKLRVESADNAGDAFEIERWARRVRALHGELEHWLGGLELRLPPSDEGRHDDGSHLR